MKAAVDGADPHLLFTPSRNVQLHVYEPLMVQDARMLPTPGLATAWRATAPDTWELMLRENVTFSDGTPFTAEDVVFSIKRAQTIEGMRTYRAYLKDIAAVEAVGPHQVRIRTHEPAAQLPFNLTTIGMVSARAARDATGEDFNGGRAAVGTGPYRWVRWTPGQAVVLERNGAYWGGEEPWMRGAVPLHRQRQRPGGRGAVRRRGRDRRRAGQPVRPHSGQRPHASGDGDLDLHAVCRTGPAGAIALRHRPGRQAPGPQPAE